MCLLSERTHGSPPRVASMTQHDLNQSLLSLKLLTIYLLRATVMEFTVFPLSQTGYGGVECTHSL
jgi:hypothetical protein